MKTLLLLPLFLLAGCASQLGQIHGSDWSKVHVGMTRAEVFQLLGPARSSTAQGNAEVLQYVEDAGVLITRQTGIWNHYHICLTNDTVTSYGPGEFAPPVPAPATTTVLVVENKFANWSTARLQLRRQQLADAIPDAVIKQGVFAPDFEKERREKEEIEMELLRRFEGGDVAAEVKPLPRDENPKLRGGRF